MPSATDAATAATARYGFASAPGRRHSNRDSSGRVPRIARTAHDRFAKPHVALIGANPRETSRLYEFTVGFRSNEAAGRWSRTPATADPKTGGSSPSAGAAAANSFVSPDQQDMWMCPLEPS